MIITCKSVQLEDSEKAKFYGDDGEYTGWLTVGKDYNVFGLIFSDHEPAGYLAIVLADCDLLFYAPLNLFDITDSRCSSHWRMRKTEFGTIAFEPTEFLDNPHFVEDYCDKVPEVVASCRNLEAKMHSEFES